MENVCKFITSHLVALLQRTKRSKLMNSCTFTRRNAKKSRGLCAEKRVLFRCLAPGLTLTFFPLPFSYKRWAFKVIFLAFCRPFTFQMTAYSTCPANFFDQRFFCRSSTFLMTAYLP